VAEALGIGFSVDGKWREIEILHLPKRSAGSRADGRRIRNRFGQRLSNASHSTFTNECHRPLAGIETVSTSQPIATKRYQPRCAQKACNENAHIRRKSNGRRGIRTCDFHRVRMALKIRHASKSTKNSVFSAPEMLLVYRDFLRVRAVPCTIPGRSRSSSRHPSINQHVRCSSSQTVTVSDWMIATKAQALLDEVKCRGHPTISC
jgi:hypothetical protein